MKKTVAIITVNYNAQQYLNSFFESISLQDHSDMEVILVDNASTDSSVTWLKENAPQAHLIVMPENVGFGEGCNIGMRYAIKELGADYLLLINNDTFLQPDLVSQLLKYTDENTVTTARIYCGGEGETLETWYAGGEIDRKTAQTKQVLYPVTESEVYEVEFISGCCMMLHRDVIAKVGYFDSQFFLYYEDVDYCVRMQNAGIKMKYVTGASLWHKVGGSSLGGSETSCSTQYYVVRNRLLFADKYSQLFKGGNLSILREILEERAFFDGIENAKHRFYVQAAIADHLKGYYGRGYYGKALLEKGYYIANGFYEREDDGEKYWYWASERCSTVYLANHKKVSGIYTVSFDLAPAVDENKPILEVVINGIDKAEYSMPGHVEFDVSVSGESVVRMDLTFRGTEKTEMVDGNMRTLYYQLLNLNMAENCRNYCVMGKMYPVEQEETDFWQWSAGKNCKVYIANKELRKTVLLFQATVESADANKYDLQIYVGGKVQAVMKTMGQCCIPIGMDTNEIRELELRCKARIVSDHGRKVCFKLKNVKITKAEKELYWGECFLPEESNGEAAWRWAIENRGQMWLVNRSEKTVFKKIMYTVIPGMEDELERFSVSIDENIIQYGVPNRRQHIVVKIRPQTVSELSINTKFKILHDNDRVISFQVHNLRMENLNEELIPDTNFYEFEENENEKWCWCSAADGTFQIVNRLDDTVIKKFMYTVIPNREDDAEEFCVYVDGDFVKYGVPSRRQHVIVKLEPQTVSELSINTKYQVFSDNNRTISFQVHNPEVENLNEELIPDANFYELEENENGKWCWCSTACGTLQIVNPTNCYIFRHIGFKVLPFGQEIFSGIKIFQNGIDITECCERNGYINIMMGLAPKEILNLGIATEWPVVQDGERSMCFCVSDIVVEEPERDIFFGSAFRGVESDGIHTWAWSAKRTGSLSIINRQNARVQALLELEVIPYIESDSLQQSRIEYRDSTETIEPGRGNSLFLNMAPYESIPITLGTDLPIHELDGQAYCFQVRNANLEKLQSGVYFAAQYYAEESSGENHWRWCSGNEGSLYIVNAGDVPSNTVLDFELMDLEGQKAEFEVWHEQVQLIKGICGKKYSIQFIAKAQNMEEVKIICHTSQKYIDGRTLCFGIRNMEIISE